MGEDVRDTKLVNDWVQVIRWARLGASTTATAVVLASYADPDGSRVFPGTARLSLDCEVNDRTVKRALRKLRQYGLIERVRRRKGSQVTEYRLVLPTLDELRQHVAVMSPDEYESAVALLNKTHRNPGWRAGHQSPAHSNVQDTSDPMCRTPQPGDPPVTLHTDPPLMADVGTDVAVERARAPEQPPKEQIPGEEAKRQPAPTTRAQQAIAEAMAHREQARRAHVEGKTA